MKLVLLAKVVVAAEAAGQEVVADAEVTAEVVAEAEAEAAVVAVAAEEAAAGVTAEIVGIAGVEAETGAGKFFSWKPGFDGRRGAAAAPRFSFGGDVAAGCPCGPHHEKPASEEAGCNRHFMPNCCGPSLQTGGLNASHSPHQISFRPLRHEAVYAFHRNKLWRFYT